MIPLSQHIWMSKWVTGWLSVAKNMNGWGMWTSMYVQPAPPVKTWPTLPFASNPTANNSWLLIYRQWRQPYSNIMPWGLFPDQHPKPITTPVELIEIWHWQKVVGNNPNACGMINNMWHKVLEWFTHNGTLYKRSSCQWLVAFLAQLWNMAWDIWAYAMELFTKPKIQFNLMYSDPGYQKNFIKAYPVQNGIGLPVL